MASLAQINEPRCQVINGEVHPETRLERRGQLHYQHMFVEKEKINQKWL